MNRRSFGVFAVWLLSALLSGATAPAQAFGSPFTLQKATYLPTFEGDMVRFEAGKYTLQREEATLRIIPAGAADGTLLQTTLITHDQEVAGPVPLSIVGKGEFPDIHILVLLLPGGDALRVVGSYSGVMPRGLFSRVKKTVTKTTQSVTKTVTDAAENVADTAKDAGDWAYDQVESAAEALKLDKINLFESAKAAADKAFQEAEQLSQDAMKLQLEAAAAVSDPARMQQLVEEAARKAQKATEMTARAMEDAWQATVDAATWLHDEAQRYMQIMVCKAMIGVFQGMDLMNALSGPVADALNAAMKPVTAGIDRATELASDIPGVEEFQQQIGGLLEDVMTDIAEEASGVLAMVEELNSNDQFADQLKNLLFSQSVCELSASELESRIKAILGPGFAMAAGSSPPVTARSKVAEPPQEGVTGKPASTADMTTSPVSAPEASQKPALQEAASAPAAVTQPTVTAPPKDPTTEDSDAASSVAAKPSSEQSAPVAPTLKQKLAMKKAQQDADRPRQTKLSTWKSTLRPQSRGDLAAQDQVWLPVSSQNEQVYAGNACAQTFVVKKAGVLSKIAFRINRNAWTTSDLALHVMRLDASGIPDPSRILISKTLSPVNVPFDPSDALTEIDLAAAGVRVDSGDRLALAVSASGPTNYNWFYEDGYKGGNGFVYTEGQWSSHDGDFAFQTEIISTAEYEKIRTVATRGEGEPVIVPITPPDGGATPIEPAIEDTEKERSSLASKRYFVAGIESAVHADWFTGAVFVGYNFGSKSITIAPAVGASASIQKGAIQPGVTVSFAPQVAYYWREPKNDDALSWDRFYVSLSFLGVEGRTLPMVVKQADVTDEMAWFYKYGVDFIGSPAEIFNKLRGAGSDKSAWENILDCFTGINISFLGGERKSVKRAVDLQATEKGNLNYSFEKALRGIPEDEPLPGVDAPPRRQYFLEILGISGTVGYPFDLKL